MLKPVMLLGPPLELPAAACVCADAGADSSSAVMPTVAKLANREPSRVIACLHTRAAILPQARPCRQPAGRPREPTLRSRVRSAQLERIGSVTIVERATVIHEQRHAVNIFLGIFSTILTARRIAPVLQLAQRVGSVDWQAPGLAPHHG